MKRNNLNRFLFLLLVLGWAYYEMTPLQDKPGRLLDRFTSESTNKVVATEIAKNGSNQFFGSIRVGEKRVRRAHVGGR